MSHIRCIYHDAPPAFPATDQHPDAKRYGPVVIEGKNYFVDAVGGAPTREAVAALLAPMTAVMPTAAEKLAAIGITAEDIRDLLKGPT